MKFGAILADPCWSYRSGFGFRSVENHYKTQSDKWIHSLPVEKLAADDCCLFLWVTMPRLIAGINTLHEWGFTYSTCAFNWIKMRPGPTPTPFMGLGYWTRSNSEICLLGTRGNPKRIAKDVHQAILAPVGKHSAKPLQVHERIERLVAGPYCELFSRSRRKGWTTLGDELDSLDIHESIRRVVDDESLPTLRQAICTNILSRGIVRYKSIPQTPPAAPYSPQKAALDIQPVLCYNAPVRGGE